MFSLLRDPSLFREFVFDVVCRIKVPKKARFFIRQVLLGWINTIDRLVKSMTLLVGPFSCFLCQKAKEDLDNLFWDCQHERAVWNSFLQEFDSIFVGQRSVRVTIEEFLLHPPFREKWCILWLAGVCAVI